jgi:hypothetical protein
MMAYKKKGGWGGRRMNAGRPLALTPNERSEIKVWYKLQLQLRHAAAILAAQRRKPAVQDENGIIVRKIPKRIKLRKPPKGRSEWVIKEAARVFSRKFEKKVTTRLVIRAVHGG